MHYLAARIVTVFTVFLLAILVSLSATAADFTYKRVTTSMNNGDGIGTGEPLPELEYYPPEESAVVGGNFIQCSAFSRTGGKCYTWGTYYTAAGVEKTGCLAVTYAASCSCNTSTGATRGNCQYYR